ncbi:MAG: single-stranded-DNA-specific exonuclease RecJ [Bacteriovoracia bacterium]
MTTTDTNIHPVVYKLLHQRNFTKESMREFFSWNLRELPNFSELKDIAKAAQRIIQAINNKEKIGVYGDYDADGTTSCAVLYHFFQLLSTTVNIYQPSRFEEGYGLHVSSIDTAIKDGIQLLITVDCGITNCEAAQYAAKQGMDLIITDHHEDGAPQMPQAYAVVNPSRRDQGDTPLKTLAGVGVAFALCLEIRSHLLKNGVEVPSIYPLLQFVSIGTICDLAHLCPTNLKLTRHGLKQIPESSYPGIIAFFPPEERKFGTIPSEKISFNVGPMINAKGRLDHAQKALQLLLAENSDKAYEYHSHLEIANRERKFIQTEVYKEAKENILNNLQGEDPVVNIVYAPHWHEGVIGIVASKLVENFEVPAMVFTDSSDEGIIKASIRSAGELDIFECLHQCSDLYKKFGGHKAAAGLSMPIENFATFKERMQKIIGNKPLIERTVQDNFDIYLDFEDITAELVKSLEILEPFGQGNNKPIFRMRGFNIDSFKLMKDVHVKWFLSSKKDPAKKLQGVSFNYVGKWKQIHPTDLYNRQHLDDLTAQFTIGINRFNGKEYLQLMIDKFLI